MLSNLKQALLLPVLVVTLFASALYSQTQTAPKATEIIQLAEKALGGEAFFNPRPYQLTISTIANDPWDGDKTVNYVGIYKEGKYHADVTLTFRKKNGGKPFYNKTIFDQNMNIGWRTAPDGVWERSEDFTRSDVPFISKNFLSQTLIFDQNTPSIIKQNGNEYYKLEAKYRASDSSDFSATFLIDTTNHFIYNYEVRNTSGTYKYTRSFLNYTKVQDIAFPQKIVGDITDHDSVQRKGRTRWETNISNFAFRDDIPDSLFDVSSDYPPPSLPVPSKTYEFFTSYAHPQWVPPDDSPEDSIVERLKSDVIDIVNNYPGRNVRYPEVLDKLARHLEGTLRTTGGRVERQEYKWRGDVWANVIASYGPENGPRIVIGAHYDAVRTSAGADDNASAVAVLLELARHLGKNPPKIRVDLAAYTLEEEGLGGSGVHAKSLKANNVDVKAMFSLEMVGYFSDAPKSQKYPISLLKLFYPSKGNFITVVSKSGSGKLVKTIKKAMADATPLPVESFVASVQRARFIARSDHGSFWLEGYPAVMITDTAEFRNLAYHAPDDVPERLDYRRMAMVAVGVINAVNVLGQ